MRCSLGTLTKGRTLTEQPGDDRARLGASVRLREAGCCETGAPQSGNQRDGGFLLGLLNKSDENDTVICFFFF